jgi:hypothetical protein
VSGHRLHNLQCACSGPCAKVVPFRSSLYCRHLVLLPLCLRSGRQHLESRCRESGGVPCPRALLAASWLEPWWG